MKPTPVRLTLPPDPSGAAQARQAVREACEGLPVDTEAAALCASELVTNALLHGRPPIELEVRRSPDSLWVGVHDAGGGLVERRRSATPTTTAGRGLHIVESMASRWGTSPRAGGKTAWFELRASSAPPSST